MGAAIWIDNCVKGIVADNVQADGGDDEFIFVDRPEEVSIKGNEGGIVRVESTSDIAVVVTNNRVHSIYVEGCDFSTIGENTVNEGVIVLDDSRGSVVENNRVWSFTAPAITIDSSDGAVVRGNVGTGTEEAAGDGFIELIGTMSDPIVEHNVYQGRISGAADIDYGIVVGAGVTGAYLARNHAPGAAVDDIDDNGTTTIIVEELSSPLTTKGDLWGFSTADARLPIGTDGDTLVADSSEALGVKWEAHAHAELWFSTAAATTISASGTPVKCAGTTTLVTDPAASMFTMPSSNRLTYEGTETKHFLVTAAVSMTAQNNNERLAFYIAKNGTVIASSEIARWVSTGSDIGALALQTLVELDEDDYVELWAENYSGTGNLTVEYGTLIATES